MRGKIGIFDSGLGGLSVWQKIVKLMPQVETIYVADQKHLPYGEKSDREIRNQSIKISRFLIQSKCSLIVVACNSATVSAIDLLRKQFKTPFIGVEPAIKPAARMSKTKEITVLATRKTIESNSQKKLIASHTKDINVHLYTAPHFVKLVDRGEIETKKTHRMVQGFFKTHPLGKSDILVLGCTHYPFLKKVMAKYIDKDIKIIDPSLAVAKQVISLRKRENNLTPIDNSQFKFYTTEKVKQFQNATKKIILKPHQVKKLEL